MAEKSILVVEGDSWFDYASGNDILSALNEKFGYKDIREVAHWGDTLKEMACDEKQFNALREKLNEVAKTNEVPRAILLSGGGNDFAGKNNKEEEKHRKYKLERLLNDKNTASTTLNEEEVSKVIDVELCDLYKCLIQKIDDTCEELFGKAVPILIHGYGYVVPDGRHLEGTAGPWLKPAFHNKGHKSLVENIETMQKLIDRFNEMIEQLTIEWKHVKYVDLRSCLSNSLEGESLKNYEKDWANEMHPTYYNGFVKIAEKFHKVLISLSC